MIEIRGDGNLFETVSTTEWDANANNYVGANKVVITVMPTPTLTQLVTDFTLLKTDIEIIIAKDKLEKELREKWPALQDVYSQYEMVKHLLEDAEKAPKVEETS